VKVVLIGQHSFLISLDYFSLVTRVLNFEVEFRILNFEF
jgi:hypothetical protein